MFPRENPYLALLKLLLAVAAVMLLATFIPWRHETAAYGLLALLAIVVLFAAYVIAIAARSAYLNWFSRASSGPAEVVRKWTRTYDYDVPNTEPGWVGLLLRLLPGADDLTTTVYKQWLFLVTFRMGEEEIELSVPERVYVSLEEGATGILTYRNERFIRFRPVQWEKSSRPVVREQGGSAGGQR